MKTSRAAGRLLEQILKTKGFATASFIAKQAVKIASANGRNEVTVNDVDTAVTSYLTFQRS